MNKYEKDWIDFNKYPKLKELVERATPKKVIPHKMKKNYYKEPHATCPNCMDCNVPRNTVEIGIKVNFCPNCGQALDWSE